jgi:hypothetical protein
LDFYVEPIHTSVPKILNPLLLKTTLDSPIIHVVAFNFEYLADVETHLNLVNTTLFKNFMKNLMGLAHA